MKSAPPLSIGAIARHAGCTVPTIRYYEEIGLLPAAPRTGGGQRHYGAAALRRLTFIRRCRKFGFSIEQVRELVGLIDAPDRPCAEAGEIAGRQLFEVRKKLSELQALESSLARLVDDCATVCAGARTADCRLIEELAIPAHEVRRPRATDACCPR